MTYRVDFSKRFKRDFSRLDRQTQRMLKGWIEKNLYNLNDPRSRGKALTGKYKGLWRYRVGNYRFICSIEDDRLVITALRVGHRREIYQ